MSRQYESRKSSCKVCNFKKKRRSLLIQIVSKGHAPDWPQYLTDVASIVGPRGCQD